jgi:hypothetical protein
MNCSCPGLDRPGGLSYNVRQGMNGVDLTAPQPQANREPIIL